MIARARSLVDRMVNNIAIISRKFNKSLCVAYDVILKKISAQSENTDELVTQMKYVEDLRVGELLLLKDKCAIAAENLMFLMDYASLIKDDIVLNRTTFSWPNRIEPIIDGT